ncbi:MAG: tRNA (adenosine(37)-N6)-dimethylallyltransferase MiaA [Candidatus Eiseniibacteriota bacterium]
MTRLPIVILGPTAAGKSEVALRVARRVGAEIVGADSRQVYRGLEIGTAAPSERDRQIAPHHLASFLSADEIYSAGRYARDARAAIEDIHARGRPTLVVGGSGLYLRALLDGLFEGPARDEAVRARLEARLKADGLDALRADLERVDPEAFATILPGDSVRVIRALEVHELTGRPVSALRRERRHQAMPAIRIGFRWPRPLLARRIEDRIQDQLRDGFLEQTRRLAAAGLPERAPGLHTLGYRELLSHLRGERSLDEAVSMIALRTRQLAKRQETWFRGVEGVEWVDLESPDQFADAADRIVARMEP